MHSFTGSLTELHALLEMDLYIGVNGKSMETQQGMELVKQIPVDKIMLESNPKLKQMQKIPKIKIFHFFSFSKKSIADAPYCEIKNKFACKKLVDTKFKQKDKKRFKPGFPVKGRNEPIRIIEVCEAVAKIKDMSVRDLARVAYENSVKVFGARKRVLLK